jgi:hypothetical protein
MNSHFFASLAAVLSTLAEVGSATPSILYVGIGMDHSLYIAVQAAMVTQGWATVSGSTVTITDAGRAVAKEIDAAIAAK